MCYVDANKQLKPIDVIWDNVNKSMHVFGSANVNTIKYVRAINITGTDLNNITDAGFYDGVDMTNAPTEGFYYITVERFSGDTAWVHQTATSFGRTIPRRFSKEEN